MSVQSSSYRSTRAARPRLVPFLYTLFIIALASLWMGNSAPTAAQSVPHDVSAQSEIEQAWQRASTAEGYQFRSRVAQLVYPAPSVRNAGRQPQEELLGLEGRVQADSSRIESTIWPDASFSAGNGIDLLVEDGRSYIRESAAGDWVEIDDMSQSFAPAGDPLSFLAGIKQVEAAGVDTRVLGEMTLAFDRYTFAIDGPTLGRYLDRLTEQMLIESGELPNGFSASGSNRFYDAIGTGEIWLDEAGYPARMVIDFTFAPEESGERIEAQINSDFYDFEMMVATAVPDFATAPRTWLMATAAGVATPERAVAFGWSLLMGLTLILLAIFVWRHAYTKEFYTTIASLIIVGLILPPLLQAQEARAFFNEQIGRSDAQNEREAEFEQYDAMRDELYGNDWNPQEDPYAQGRALQAAVDLANVQAAQAAGTALIASSETDTTADSDGDGATDDDEIFWDSCPYLVASVEYSNADDCLNVTDPADSDGDGLTDYTEIYELGTLPDEADSDGDTIADNLEVKGFDYNGETWYLNPLEDDTNNDGRSDGAECDVWSSSNVDGDTTAICPDNDNDGTPDLYDFDDDNDGVWDIDDGDSQSVSQVFGRDNPMLLTVDGLTVDKPVLVDIQMRPEDESLLTASGLVLDWPTGDYDGQIVRGNETTFATTTDEEAQSDEVTAAYGDIRVIPLLRITIPYTEGHYGNLPVNDDYYGIDRTIGITINQWLDPTELDQFGITVSDVDATSGTLDMYVPVSTVYSQAGERAVGFSATTFYSPTQGTNGVADWGSAHEYSLIWMVQMISDACVADLDEDGDGDTENESGADCTRADDMTTIHLYEEDWRATSLAVSEEQGLATAVMYEDPSQDDDLTLDEQLWIAGWNLGNTFVAGLDCDTTDVIGSCIGDGTRDVTIDDISTQLDEWGTADNIDYSYIEMEGVDRYIHSDYLAYTAVTTTAEILDTHFLPYVGSQEYSSLLFAYETASRSLGLIDNEGSGGQIVLDLTDRSSYTTAGVFLKTYAYDNNDGWAEAENEAYYEYFLEALEAGDSYFQAEDDSEEALEDQQGKLLWMQNYYITLTTGTASMVAVDDTAFNSVSFETSEEADDFWLYVTLAIGVGSDVLGSSAGGRLSYVVSYYLQDLRGKSNNLRNMWSYLKSMYTIDDFGFAAKRAQGKAINNFYKDYKLFNSKLLGKVVKNQAIKMLGISLGLFVFGALIVAVGFVVSAAGDSDAGNTIMQIGLVVVAIASLAVLGLEALALFAKMSFVVNLNRSGLSIAKGFQRAMNNYGKLYRMHAKWGLAIGVLVAGAVLMFSWISLGFDTSNPYFDAAAAYFVATVIVEIIFAILIALFPVGTAIAIVIELIDVILLLVSLFVDDFDFTIQGWLSEVLADLMYNVDMVAANVESDKRINTEGDYDLWDSELGFVESNTLAFTLTVTNTLYTTDSRSDLKRNTFAHALDTAGNAYRDFSPDDGDMVNDWQNTNDGSYNADGVGGVKYSTSKGVYSVEDIAIDFPFTQVGTGINRSTQTPYFNEAFFLIAEGCWHVFAIQGTEYNCKELTFDGGDSSELDPFTFDILPDHLGDFITLNWNGSGRMAFPAQHDKDGDGAANSDFGGTDPNDLLWDTDGDLMSDYYESTNGFDPTDADQDDDGLTDWEELFVYYTDPTEADYDGDGLGDYIEVKAGWLTSYTDENGVERTTRVWSDPYTADLDDDGVGDLQEYIYGFHPALASDLSAVDTFIEFADLRLDESDTPLLYLPLDDELGDTAIDDLAGNEYHFACDDTAGTCPTAEVLGQFGTAMSFDNVDDYLINDELNLNVDQFTIAAFVYNGATDSSAQPVFGSTSGYTADSPPSIAIFDNRDIIVGFGDGTSWNSISPGNYFLDSEEWVHVAATYDGEQLRVLVNGLAVYNDNAYAGSVPATITEMTIGRNGSDYLDGTVDEAFFYDRALTADEIDLLIDGRYNLNDLFVPTTGGELRYQATVSNTTVAVNTDGFIHATAELIDPLLPEPTLYLGFDEDQRWATFDNAFNIDSDVYCYDGGSTCPTNETTITAVGNSLEFDGNDDVAFVPSLTSSSNDSTLAGSLFFWLYIDEYPTAGTKSVILDTESVADGAADIYLDENGNLYMDIVGSGVTQLASAVALDTWLHVGYQRGTIYNDGVSQGWTGGARPKFGAGSLGADLNGENHFDGVLDEIVVFHKWVGESQIQNKVMLGLYSFSGIKPHAVIKFEDVISTNYTVFSDPSHYSNHAYCEADTTCPSEVTGRSGTGTAVLFDGVDDYLVQPDTLQAIDEYYTYDGELIFYLYPTAYPAAGEIAQIYESDASSGFGIYLDDAGRMAVRETYGSYSVLKDAIPLNEWTKVKFDFFYDEVDISDISQQRMWRYINNQYATDFVGNAARSYFAFCTDCDANDDDGFFVGAGRIGNNSAGTAPFQGRIDDFNIEIAEHDFDRYERTLNYVDPVHDLIRTDCDLLENCPVFGSGFYGNGAYFNGSVSLDLNEQLDFGRGDYTVSFWYYADFALDQTMFTAYDDSGDIGVQIDLMDTGQVSYSHALPLGTTLTQVQSNGAESYTDSSWHHLIATKDDDTLYLYLDGALAGSVSGVSGTAADNLNVTIGNTIDDKTKRWFYGFIDELAIFDEAVSAEQAAYLAETRFPALDVPVPYETFALDSGDTKVISGTAAVNDPVATSRYGFEQDVEVAIDLETELSYTTYENVDGVWSAYFRFEEVPGDVQFDNLVAYGTGGTAAEVDGNCEADRCPVGGVHGIDGRAAYFDGEDDYLLADFSGVDGSAQPNIRSLSAWVKGADGVIFDSRGVAQNGGFQLGMGSLINGDGEVFDFDMPRNEWTHIALTIDDNDEAAVYINGAVVLNGVAQTTDSSGAWWIGANYGPQSHFLGYLDEFKLFETELTAAEITDLYENVGALFRFSFDEEAGETNFVDSVNGYVAEPTMINCVDLTLVSLTGAGFATNLGNIGLALNGNTLLYDAANDYDGTTAALNIATAVCGSDGSLSATGVYSDGTEFTFGTAETISLSNSGTTTTTLSNSGQQLTLVYTIGEMYQDTSPLVGTDGRIGNTAYFTGEDDGHIEVTTAGLADFSTDDFTLMGWINTDETGVGVLSKSDGDTSWESGERSFYVADDGTLQFAGYNDGRIYSTKQITDSTWHHFALVWDSSILSGTILVDGIDVSDGATDYAPSGGDNSGDSLRIGVPDYDAVTDYFAGQLDELVLYTGRALTAVEVYDSYQQEARWYRDSAEFVVIVDGDDPTVEVETDYAYRSDGYIQLVVSADDASSYVSRLRYKYRKEGSGYSDWIEAPICADAAAAVYCPYITSSGGGVYSFLFQAVDGVGNMTETTDSFSIYVDTGAPTMSAVTDGSGDVAVSVVEVSDDSWTLTMSGPLSDPDITGSSIDGSGVYTPAIYVNLYDENGGLVGSANQLATYSADTWSIDYLVMGEAPAGYYDVSLTAADVIGNEVTNDLGQFVIDLQGPVLETALDLLPEGVISQTATITGVIVDQAEYHNPVLNFHFEEPDGETTFYDYGELASHVACTADCPQTTASGQFGRGLAFNGIDQTDFVVNTSAISLSLSITEAVNFGVDDPFTIAFWVKADEMQVNTAGETNSLVEKWDGSGAYPYAIRYHNQTSGENGRISASVFDGASVTEITSTVTITDGAFHHVVLTNDGDTYRLYIDGRSDRSMTLSSAAVVTSTADLSLGHIVGDDNSLFSGVIDQFSVYDKALSAARIYAMAQADVSGLGQVEVVLEVIDFTNYPANIVLGDREGDLTWSAATLDQPNGLGSAWTYALGEQENWFYIHMRGQDGDGRQHQAENVWRGLIDHRVPTIVASGSQAYGGSYATSSYTFTMTDFLLDETTLVHPCGADDLVKLTYDSVPVDAPYYGLPYQISGSCTVPGHVVSETLSICDAAYHCADHTIDFGTDEGVNVMFINSPADGAIISPTKSITLTGELFAKAAPYTVELKIDNSLIETIVFDSGITETAWSYVWDFPDGGSHLLNARVKDDNGETASANHTFTIDGTCSVDYDGDDVTDFETADSSAVRQGLAAASSGATVRVAGICEGVVSENGTDQLAYLSQAVTLEGGYDAADWAAGSNPDATPTFLDGAGLGRVLYIPDGTDVVIKNISLVDGYDAVSGGGIYVAQANGLTFDQVDMAKNTSEDGGAMYIVTGTVTIADSYFADNNAGGDAGVIYSNEALYVSGSYFYDNVGEDEGGVIRAKGVLSVTTSTFYDNEGLFGGAIYTDEALATIEKSTFEYNYSSFVGGGALWHNSGTLNLNNSTLSRNRSALHAGALMSLDTAVLRHVTVVSNSAQLDGGALYNNGGTIDLYDSIVAYSSGEDCYGGVVDHGGNIASDSTCGFTESTSVNDTDPLVAPLADNGGETQTHALDQSSPAIDRASGSSFAEDQRGVVRPQYASPDSGAYEFSVLDSCTDSPWTVSDYISLETAIVCYNDQSSGSGLIELAGDISLTGGLTALNNPAVPLVIEGNGYTLNAGTNDRHFEIESGVVSLADVTLRDGSQSANGGSIYIHAAADVTIDRVTFKDNTARNRAHGGSIYNEGVVVITNSYFDTDGGWKGGSIANLGLLTLDKSTIYYAEATMGGGVYNNGASAVLTVTNSSFHLNYAYAFGSAIYNDGGTTHVTHGTFVENDAEFAALENGSGMFNLTMSVVSTGYGSNCDGTITDGGGNIASDNSCGFTAGTSLNNTNPQVSGTLADNGGGTQTHAILSSGSPAVDVADCVLADDQRGVARPDGLRCDSGAYEFEFTPITVTPTLTYDSAGELTVDWATESSATGCEADVYRNTSPYTGHTEWQSDLTLWSVTDAAAGDENSYYFVWLVCDGDEAAVSEEVGVFHFELEAGE